jgi:hypothetical protein
MGYNTAMKKTQLIPPFRPFERKLWIWNDDLGGASLMEWWGLACVVLVPVLLFI